MPLPVPWFAGCGGHSGFAASAFPVSDFPVSALATIAFEVSATSARAGIALVIAVVGCAAPAEASLAPALIWTVFTLTGFIGSDEPGIAAIAWVWITPLVSGAGSVFSDLDSGLASSLASDLISDLCWAGAAVVAGIELRDANAV